MTLVDRAETRRQHTILFNFFTCRAALPLSMEDWKRILGIHCGVANKCSCMHKFANTESVYKEDWLYLHPPWGLLGRLKEILSRKCSATTRHSISESYFLSLSSLLTTACVHYCNSIVHDRCNHHFSPLTVPPPHHFKLQQCHPLLNIWVFSHVSRTGLYSNRTGLATLPQVQWRCAFYDFASPRAHALLSERAVACLPLLVSPPAPPPASHWNIPNPVLRTLVRNISKVLYFSK